MTSSPELRFFATLTHDCSYLLDREAKTLFVDPTAEINTQLYTTLSSLGFRRSGNHIYRPYCQSCSACIPLRIPVKRFQPVRRQKRTLRYNNDLSMSQQIPMFNDEYYELYVKYICQRHQDGDMFPPSPEQFARFLVTGRRSEAIFFEFRKHHKLLAVAVADQLDDSLAAIYTFFDPEVPKRSLGGFAILWLIEETKRLGLEYLYLGYWIKDCQKMSYKIDYRPLEVLIKQRWVCLTR